MLPCWSLFADQGISPLQQRNMLQRLFPGKRIRDDTILETDEELLIFFERLLRKQTAIKPDEVEFIVNQTRGAITEFAKEYDRGSTDNFQVAICDDSHVTWTGLEGFYYLQTGEFQERLASEILISTSFQLKPLLERCRVFIQRCVLSKETDHDNFVNGKTRPPEGVD